MTLSRRSRTSDSVASSDGADLGIAVNTAASPFLLTVIGDTDATSGVFLTSSLSVVSRGSVAGDSACFFFSSSSWLCLEVCFWASC